MHINWLYVAEGLRREVGILRVVMLHLTTGIGSEKHIIR